MDVKTFSIAILDSNIELQSTQGARIHNVKDELESFCGKVTDTQRTPQRQNEHETQSSEGRHTVPCWTLNKDVDDLAAEQFVNEELFKKITGRSEDPLKNIPGIP